MKGWVAKTQGPEILGGLGGFAGLYDAHRLTAYTHPVLATSTDGVGTKVAIAQQMDVHDTIGFDLVGMVVDDIVVCGAEPLFMTDYIACGHGRAGADRGHRQGHRRGLRGRRLRAGRRRDGRASGPARARTSTTWPAPRPGWWSATGSSARIGCGRATSLVAMASSGLHSNGYSLVRTVVGAAGWELDRDVPELGRTLGAELLEPTRVYAGDVLDLVDADLDLHALSHVTGGGLAANLARVLPPGLLARVDRSTWAPAPIFGLVAELGGVPPRRPRADAEHGRRHGRGRARGLGRRRHPPAGRARPPGLGGRRGHAGRRRVGRCAVAGSEGRRRRSGACR